MNIKAVDENEIPRTHLIDGTNTRDVIKQGQKINDTTQLSVKELPLKSIITENEQKTLLTPQHKTKVINITPTSYTNIQEKKKIRRALSNIYDSERYADINKKQTYTGSILQTTQYNIKSKNLHLQSLSIPVYEDTTTSSEIANTTPSNHQLNVSTQSTENTKQNISILPNSNRIKNPTEHTMIHNKTICRSPVKDVEFSYGINIFTRGRPFEGRIDICSVVPTLIRRSSPVSCSKINNENKSTQITKRKSFDKEELYDIDFLLHSIRGDQSTMPNSIQDTIDISNTSVATPKDSRIHVEIDDIDLQGVF